MPPVTTQTRPRAHGGCLATGDHRRSCQKTHWKGGHKADCTQQCVIEYKGGIRLTNTPDGDTQEFVFKKTLPSRALAIALKTVESGQAVIEDMIEEFREAKWNLRAHWKCVHCPADATQIVSLPCGHAVIGAIGDPPSSMLMMEIHAEASCDRHLEATVARLEKIGTSMLAALEREQEDMNIVVTNGRK